MGVTEQGLAAIVKTRGNKDVHVILRGGNTGPNYYPENVKQVAQAIEKATPSNFASIMVDCSRACLAYDHTLTETHVICRWKFTKETF
jgi:3-deoxy-7-phosphoheptulonate synthase